MTYHWMDADRAEVFTADPADRRELMAQIWYPARKDPSAARAAWVPDAEALAPALARASQLPRFTFGHFKYLTTNAIPFAPVAAAWAGVPIRSLSAVAAPACRCGPVRGDTAPRYGAAGSST